MPAHAPTGQSLWGAPRPPPPPSWGVDRTLVGTEAGSRPKRRGKGQMLPLVALVVTGHRAGAVAVCKVADRVDTSSERGEECAGWHPAMRSPSRRRNRR